MKHIHYGLCAASLLLCACGGGGESSSSQPSSTNNQAPQATTSSTTNDTASTDESGASSTQSSSSALSQHSAQDNAQFAQFRSHNLNIDITGLGFTAPEVFVKVYTLENQTLFLGKVANTSNFEFYLPNDVTRIKYDVFSVLKADPQITKEVEL